MKGFKEYLKIYGSIKEETFAELQSNFEKRNLSKKEIFSHEGEYAQKIGFLEEGIVRAFIRTEEGKEYTKQFFFAPSLIGAYTSLLTHQPNRIIQQALTNCTVWIADYSKMEALYSRYH